MLGKNYLNMKHHIRNNLPFIMYLYQLKKNIKRAILGIHSRWNKNPACRPFSSISDCREYYLKKLNSLYDSLASPGQYDKPWVPDTCSYKGVKGVVKVGQIEITNMCNLNCKVCRTKSALRKPTIMPLKKFEHYIKEAKKAGTYLIDLHCVGETFMHPELEGIFKICKKHGVEIYKISSNGQLLDKYVHLIFKYAYLFQFLRFSIDGGTREVYEKVRVGGSFDKLIANLEQIHNLNLSKNRPVRIFINSVVCSDTIDDIPNSFITFSKYVPHPDNLSFSLYEDVMMTENEFNEENRIFLGMPKISFCKQPWEWLNVLSDGSVTYCCHEFNWDTVVGDLNKQSLKEIWNGPELARHRKMHLERNFPEGMSCKHCLDTTLFSKQLANIYIHFVLGFDPVYGKQRFLRDFKNLLRDISNGLGTDRGHIKKNYFYQEGLSS